MKVKEILQTTNNSTVYKRMYRRYNAHKEGLCDRCRRHSGCNGMFKNNKSWKNYRRTQYKNINYHMTEL